MRALHTPQQETNSAYNPGVTFQGGQFLAQGISQAGDAITEGLQRYAANKQESAALDMRFEGTAKPLMEKLKLYGQLADENSPAAALLDKSADWHKLGNNQKKVLLADMLLLGDKTEAEQRRKEAEQYKLLEIQDRQAQFEELKKHRQAELSRNLGNDAWRMMGDVASWNRNAKLDAIRAAAEGMNLKVLQANLDSMQTKAQQTAKDRAAYSTLLQFQQPMQGNEQGPMPSVQFNAARAMQQTGGSIPPEDIAALEKLGRIPRVGTMTDIAGDPTGKFLWQADNAGYRVDTGKGDKPARIRVTTKIGDQTIEREVTPEEADRLLNESRPAPDPETAGRIAQLEHLLQQSGGKDFAFDYDKTQGYSTSRMMHTGESAKAELARLKGQRGGGSPASSPAAASNEVKRTTSDGRTAVFDATTKKFLRYAD